MIAEAKYRDLAPSSLTGTNLVTQELGGSDGLAAHATRQQDRLEYFRTHRDSVLDGLNPEQPTDSYTVQSYVVTKQVPLVHKYMETGVLRAFEFLEVVVAG